MRFPLLVSAFFLFSHSSTALPMKSLSTVVIAKPSPVSQYTQAKTNDILLRAIEKDFLVLGDGQGKAPHAPTSTPASQPIQSPPPSSPPFATPQQISDAKATAEAAQLASNEAGTNAGGPPPGTGSRGGVVGSIPNFQAGTTGGVAGSIPNTQARDQHIE
ncbi:hypothetical protein BJ875DRAFT_496719 [Amylocarpus encephaloides]|uniref:Uncharacterized protein n=1 Tax=Amylocarpus encephaloides TaxID=45428 RepID=A0A9P7YH69_9HELO|nr:hypothetical protein BJ875DRAFT_496719 [Amylocarpus encephaloides]